VTFVLIKEIGELALIAACLYLALGAYVHRRQPEWSALLKRRRFGVLLLLVLAVVGIKVSEDVVTGESGPVDNFVLQFIHANVPPPLRGLFEAVTITGSGYVLSPLSASIVIAFLGQATL
jgi:hypothetical protein